MNKKTVIAIILVLLIGVTGTILSASMALKGLKSRNPDNIQNEPKTQVEEVTEDGNIVDKEEELTDYFKDEEAVELPTKSDAMKLTKANADAIEEQVRRLYREFKFQEATELLLSYVEKYNVDESEYAETLRKLYMESALMHHISTIESFDSTIVSLTKNVTDPENHMLATLFIEGSMRESLIHKSNSINPDFYGGVNVKSKKAMDSSEPVFKEAKLEDNDLEKLYEFEISVETYPLRAYIAESNGRTYFFKLVEEEEGSTPFYTFTEWRELEEKLNLK